MNAGFSSLTALKAAVLPDGLRESTEYDNALVALGLGVAAQMEKFCNRKFQRIAEDEDFATYETPGGVMVACVDRYPIESVELVQMLPSAGSTWETVTDRVSQFYAAAGIVEFTDTLGTRHEKLRITFAGGYWWNTEEEPEDTLPPGATPLPLDLLNAWHMGVQAVIRTSDLLKAGAAHNDKETDPLKAFLGLDLLPIVKLFLKQHIRHGI
jgi:hypothetical protein